MTARCPACFTAFPPENPGATGHATACPVCQYGPLPPDWFASQVTCVAMTGARSSGKSVYVAVAIDQLRAFSTRWGAPVDFADDTSRQHFQRHYEEPLLITRAILPPTMDSNVQDSAARLPMIVSLGIRNGRRAYLVLRDVAGESLTPSSDHGVDHLSFIARADCVLFMFDPVRVTTVTDLLHDLIPNEDLPNVDPIATLKNVLRIIGGGRPHLAVVLAKFDIMEQLRAVAGTGWSRVMSNSGSAMLRDPGMSSRAYNAEDGDLLSAEVRSLLLRLHANELISAVENPANGNRLNHRYFAVSMLGEPTRSGGVSTRGIKPFRCLDPLRWALASSGQVL